MSTEKKKVKSYKIFIRIDIDLKNKLEYNSKKNNCSLAEQVRALIASLPPIPIDPITSINEE